MNVLETKPKMETAETISNANMNEDGAELTAVTLNKLGLTSGDVGLFMQELAKTRSAMLAGGDFKIGGALGQGKTFQPTQEEGQAAIALYNECMERVKSPDYKPSAKPASAPALKV